MTFIKENSYVIFKMIVNQIGMIIFGVAVSMATQKYDTLYLIASIFSVLFYMVLLYTMTWEEGYKQSQQILSGRKPFVKLGGLYMSLIANALNILLGVLMVVGFYSAAGREFIFASQADGGEIVKTTVATLSEANQLYLSSPDWTQTVYGIGLAGSKLLSVMFDGIVYSMGWTVNPWMFVIFVVPPIATCTVAYYLGVKGKHFTKFLGKEPDRD